MQITNVYVSAGKTGFFFDDQRAIKAGAIADGASYKGEPITPGFRHVRQAGESVSIMLRLSDGQVATGDACAVQYSGAGGRDPLFLAEPAAEFFKKHLSPKLIGRKITTFTNLADEFDALQVDGKPLHTALRYGISQALLDAVAKSQHRQMCEVIHHEFGGGLVPKPIPIFAQTGDTRYENADKIILKEADVLPHGLINNVQTKLGTKGEKLLEYITWLRNRVLALRQREDYAPVLHLDVYGTIGLVFGETNYDEMCAYLASLAAAAAPLSLRIEGPVDMGEREAQIEALAKITAMVDERGVGVQIVADEWCNTLEDIQLFTDNRAGHMAQIKTPDLGSIADTARAVLYCNARGMLAYQGGTCNETDVSARACVHVAMATRPVQMLAKPGMGVDEGFMVVTNEMNRIIAQLEGGI